MRRIGQKAFLRAQRFIQALQQIVHRLHQGQHLLRHRAGIERREVFGLAGTNALLQPVQGLNAPRQRQPHQQHGQRQDGKLRQHHAFDDFSGQHAALFPCFCHLHQHLPPRGQGQRNPQGGNPDGDAAQLIIAQLHLPQGGQAGAALHTGKVMLTGNPGAIQMADLVVHQIGIVRAQHFVGRQSLVKTNAAIGLDAHLLGQGMGVVFQSPVKRLVGQGLRHQPRQRQAQRPQQ